VEKNAGVRGGAGEGAAQGQVRIGRGRVCHKLPIIAQMTEL